MTTKQVTEKRYVVKLSDGRLNTLIRAGKHPARQLTKARILLKADASETGEDGGTAKSRSGPLSDPMRRSGQMTPRTFAGWAKAGPAEGSPDDQRPMTAT